MSCCHIQLGEVPHNEPVNLGIQAEKAGEYSFRLKFLHAVIYQKQTVEIGDDLIIPGPFNESHTYTVVVRDPDGDEVPGNIDETTTCDTWTFTTFIKIDGDCGDTCDSDDDSDSGEYS